jgi:hypothetical protein
MSFRRFEPLPAFTHREALMKRNAGHIMRLSGLVIEMLGIWGVYSSTGARDQARFLLPGGTVVTLPWLAVGGGFVLWLTGTILVYATRPRRKTRILDE